MATSIPLPALAVNTQQESPIQQYQKIIGIRGLLQQQEQAAALAPGQQQLQQQAITGSQQEQQMRDIQLKDAQAGLKAMQSWDGKDPNALPDLIRQNGGSLNAVMSAKQAIVKQQTDFANMNKAQLEANKTKSDYLLGKLQAASDPSIPDEQLGPSILQAAQDSVKDGYLDPQHAATLQQLVQQSATPADLRSHLSIYVKSLMSQSEQLAQTSKQKELENQKETADAAMLRAKNTSPSAEGVAAAAAQGDPNAIATQKNLVDQAAAKAAAESSARLGGEVSLATARAKAEQAVKNGSAEDAGKMLAAGVIAPSEIAARSNPSFLVEANKAAQAIDPNFNAQKAEADFNVAKSQSNTPFFGSAKSLTNKGGTLDQLAANYAKLKNGSIPLFNKVEDYAKYQAGDPALAGFMQTAIGAADDYAKVMGGGTGSDSARLEVLQSLSNAHGPAAMKAALDSARAAVGSQVEARIGNNKALRNMYGDQSNANTGGGGATPKVLTMAQIQQAAKDHNVSVDEATKQAKAAGYTVQQ